MIEIIPAILEKDFGEIEKKIHLVEGLVHWVQIDIADNTLVPNTTFLDPEPFKNFTGNVRRNFAEVGKDFSAYLPNSPRPFQGLGSNTVGVLEKLTSPQNSSPLFFELHMMVKNPLKYLESFANAGFKRFFAHVEGDFVPEYIEKCNNLGVEAGLAIDGPTDFEQIHKYMFDLDCILVMAIEAGFSGRPFRQNTVDKIKKIREVDFEIPITVDGAMNDVNAKKVIDVGATRINSNSYIFDAEDIKGAIEKLKCITVIASKAKQSVSINDPV